jgi:hypothetical protein
VLLTLEELEREKVQHRDNQPSAIPVVLSSPASPRTRVQDRRASPRTGFEKAIKQTPATAAWNCSSVRPSGLADFFEDQQATNHTRANVRHAITHTTVTVHTT